MSEFKCDPCKDTGLIRDDADSGHDEVPCLRCTAKPKKTVAVKRVAFRCTRCHGEAQLEDAVQKDSKIVWICKRCRGLPEPACPLCFKTMGEEPGPNGATHACHNPECVGSGDLYKPRGDLHS